MDFSIFDFGLHIDKFYFTKEISAKAFYLVSKAPKTMKSGKEIYICSAHSCRVSRKSDFFLPFPRVQPDETA